MTAVPQEKAAGFDADFQLQLGQAPNVFALQVRLNCRTQRTVICGPSGAGKSLTLQTLAGLQTPAQGHIRFSGETLFDSTSATLVPASRRQFGFVFQDYALFPHLNVRQNITFALSRGWRNPGAQEVHARVDHWLNAFELMAVAMQYPHTLSGGQRQRTALARALVNEPRALLLDEPFTALDKPLRSRLRAELDAVLQTLNIPVVLITHDADDMDWFGGELFQMRDGCLRD
jgi:molybdate transport system ATP-binding protein